MNNEAIQQFSPHLFWDVDKEKLDIERNKRYIVKHVLNYGLMKDWNTLKKHYSIQQIGQEAMKIRDLDVVSASFIALIADLPLKQFRCYTIRQLFPPHWEF